MTIIQKSLESLLRSASVQLGLKLVLISRNFEAASALLRMPMLIIGNFAVCISEWTIPIELEAAWVAKSWPCRDTGYVSCTVHNLSTIPSLLP